MAQYGEESTAENYPQLNMRCVFGYDADKGMKTLQPSARAQMLLANSRAKKTIIIPVRWTMDISKVPLDKLASDDRAVKWALVSGNLSRGLKKGEYAILGFYPVSALCGQTYEGADLETILKQGVRDMPRLKGEVYSALPFRDGVYQNQVIEAMANLARSEYQHQEGSVLKAGKERVQLVTERTQAEQDAIVSLLSLYGLSDVSAPLTQKESVPEA